MRNYYKQLYGNKFNNFDEMDKLLKRHKLPKCTQNEIDNLNSPITIEEIEFSLNLQAQIASKFYQTYVNSTQH